MPLPIFRNAFTNSQMNKLLVWMAANQANGETAAAYFLKNHTAVGDMGIGGRRESKRRPLDRT